MAASIKVIHAANDGVFGIPALTPVRSIRASLVDAFNIPLTAFAFVNGEPVGEAHGLLDNDTVEFVVPWGRKRGGQPADQPLTVKEAAAELRCSISFVYKLMRVGELSYEKRGRRKLPLQSAVEGYRSRNVVHALLAPGSTPNTTGSKRYKHLFN